MAELTYRIIRSKRKTIQLQITKDLELVVRSPEHMPIDQIQQFVVQHADWAEKTIPRVRTWYEAHPEPTEAEKQAYIDKARRILPEKLAYYSEQMGVRPGKIRITGARTRYGSCNTLGNLCFSWRLMAYPDEAIDALVVHELAHLRHMNHKKEFYSEVYRILPDYQQRIALLKNCQPVDGQKDESRQK